MDREAVNQYIVQTNGIFGASPTAEVAQKLKEQKVQKKLLDKRLSELKKQQAQNKSTENGIKNIEKREEKNSQTRARIAELEKKVRNGQARIGASSHGAQRSSQLTIMPP